MPDPKNHKKLGPTGVKIYIDPNRFIIIGRRPRKTQKGEKLGFQRVFFFMDPILENKMLYEKQVCVDKWQIVATIQNNQTIQTNQNRRKII